MAEKQVRIAAIVFLTGDQASLGEEINNAFQIAKGDFEAQTDMKIDLKIEDSGDDPKNAISAYEKLKSEGYLLIIATGDAVTAALAPLAAQDHIVLFSTVAASNDVGNEWTFRGWITSAQQGKPLGEFISSLGTPDIGIIRLDNIFSVSLLNALKESLSNTQIKAEESYGIADNDVKTQVLKIKAANPSAILISGFGPTYPIIFRQLKELSVNKPIFADATIAIPYFFEAVGGYGVLNDVYFITTGFDLENPTPKAADFIQKYGKFSKNPPSFTAAFGYDTFMVTAQTLLKCGSSPETIKSCLANVNGYEGILGPLSFNSQGQMQIPLVIRHYKDGKNKIVKTLE